jgi:hypothetical protein
MKSKLPPLTAEQRRLRAQIGAHEMHARYSPIETTKAGRTTFLAKFETLADPDGVMSEAERAEAARHLLQAHMKRLALKSSRVRAARKAASEIVIE